MGDKKAKNPKRVAAGKKAWRKAHRGGGKVTRRKGGRARAYAKKASHTIGKLVKTLAVLTPPTVVAVQSYHFWDEGGAQKGRGVVHALADFSSCFSGITVDAGGEAVWMPKRLAVGWGPVLVIGGIQYAERKIGMEAANPFRVMSAGLG